VKMTGISRDEMLGRDHLDAARPFYGAPRRLLLDMLEIAEALQVTGAPAKQWRQASGAAKQRSTLPSTGGSPPSRRCTYLT